jgi:hypothetical protein
MHQLGCLQHALGSKAGMLLRPLPADERCAAAPSPRMPAGSLPHLPAGVWRCLDGGGSAARAPWPCLQWVHTCACPATPCAPASALLCCIHTTPPAPTRMCPPASCPRAALTPPAPPLLLLSPRPPAALSSLPPPLRSFTLKPFSRECPSLVRPCVPLFPACTAHAACPRTHPAAPPLAWAPGSRVLHCQALTSIHLPACLPPFFLPCPAVHDEICGHLKAMGLPTTAKGNAGQGEQPLQMHMPLGLHAVMLACLPGPFRSLR